VMVGFTGWASGRCLCGVIVLFRLDLAAADKLVSGWRVNYD
jgi:hypothetical protein